MKRAEDRGFLRHFCSNKCMRDLGPLNPKGNSKNLKKGGRVPTEYSPFRYFANKAKIRNKDSGFEKQELSVEFLKQLWDQQEGICPLTGWKMILPPSTSYWSRGSATRRDIASLDRIDSNKPYCVGNVRFIAHIANMAKYIYTDQDVYVFCESVVKHKNGTWRVRLPFGPTVCWGCRIKPLGYEPGMRGSTPRTDVSVLPSSFNGRTADCRSAYRSSILLGGAKFSGQW